MIGNTYCDQCGAQLASMAKFCHDCGASIFEQVASPQTEPTPGRGDIALPKPRATRVPTAPPTSVPIVPPTTRVASTERRPSRDGSPPARRQDDSWQPGEGAQGHLRCPQCRRADQVLKASAIVASGTMTGTATGSSVGVGRAGDRNIVTASLNTTTATSQSALAQRLAQPRDPFTPLAPAIRLGCVALVVVGAAAGCATLSRLASPNDAATSNLFWGTILVLGLLAAWYFPSYFHAKAAQRDAIARDTVIWRRAMARWQGLYFCLRCEGVFNPAGEATFIPTPSRRELLHHLEWHEF